MSGEGGLSISSKQFTGLKSALFTSNTILEEISNASSSNSKSSSGNIKQSTDDIHFPGLLSTHGRDSILDNAEPYND